MKIKKQQELIAEITQDLNGLTRRRFIKAASGAAVLMGVGGISACSGSVDTKAATTYLSSELVNFFERFSQILLPTEGSRLTPVKDVPLIENLNTMFSTMEEDVRKGLGMAVNLFEYGGWVLGGHFSRFSKMDDKVAVEYIDQWQSGHHVQQGIATILKKLVYGAYWQHESTWPPLEFDGPVSDKWGLVSLGEAPLPEAQ